MPKDICGVLFHWVLFRLFGQQQPMLEEEPERRRRRHWIHPIVAQRIQKGQFHTLYNDLRQDPFKFHNFCRMSMESFDHLLTSLHPDLNFRDTSMRRSISAEQRLIVTLRFLATGNSFASLHFEFLLGISTISGIVCHTCKVIWQRLRDAVMPTPKAEDWLRIAEGFFQSAQFPNCIGALDGKHIRVKKPPHSGSRFFNYKQYFSVVLMALVDSNYKIHDASADADLGQNVPSSVNFDLSRTGRPGTAGLAVRDFYADFFSSPEGALPWQLEAIRGSR
ncbi:uncharacterized protein LOC122925927 [Bufo gargarizans]|uniref:uncharacterized protein LOC122925927 n=1 Tax=Bufo gargarizans TaxID=30331 RepID=UPI001CF544BB|nr:uncharacterized protein LOC122925927 [Bufo gargarizans]